MKTLRPKRLAIFQASGKQFPKSIISLLEIMREFDACKILETDRFITSWIAHTKKPPGLILTQGEAEDFRMTVWDFFEDQCRQNGWENTGNRVFALKYIIRANPPPSYESLNTALREVQFALYNELKAIKFAMVENKKSHYFEQNNLFGDPVNKSLPSATKEISSAGNCLAADLPTASVFHLMRTVNIGTRALARHLDINKIAEKELEFCGDGKIIEEIEKAVASKLDSVNGKGTVRDEKWESENAFYRGLLVDLRFFKDVVRDPIAHARKTYTENGALDVYDHVRDFMQRLAAGGISE